MAASFDSKLGAASGHDTGTWHICRNYRFWTYAYGWDHQVLNVCYIPTYAHIS